MPRRLRPTVKNPVIGKHPDMFQRTFSAGGGASDPGDSVDTDVVENDWRLTSPGDLKRAVTDGTLAGEDLDEVIGEMEAYAIQAKADGDLSMLLDDGMSQALAREVAGGKHEALADQLRTLDEEGRERRAAPFIKFIRSRAKGHLEYEWAEGNDGFNNNFDAFEQDLENISFKHLKKAAGEVLGGTNRNGELTDEARQELLDIEDALIPDGGTPQEGADAFEAILRDPGIYKATRQGEYTGHIDGTVWGFQIGTTEDQCDGTKYDEQLNAIVHGGEYRHHAAEGAHQIVENYAGMSQEDLDYAVEQLENHEPYVYFDQLKLKDLDNSFNYTISEYEGEHFTVFINVDELRARLADAGYGESKESDEPEQGAPEVVYVYAGTNEFVAGASARGMYVVKLTSRDLKAESTALGHCIGNEQYGHPAALRDGRAVMYSIRTEAGKPKFTIELDRIKYFSKPPLHSIKDEHTDAHISGDIKGLHTYALKIAEVKGKANRLPGFESFNDGAAKKGFSKPDDLRLVTDFLLHLGFTPEDIVADDDVAPGVAAMLETGKDPFKPPAVRQKKPPTTNPAARVSSRVAALLRRTQPMGSFR